MRINTANLIQRELQRLFPEVKEFFLYGSVSKDYPYYNFAEQVHKRPDFDENSDYDFAIEYTPEIEQVFMKSDWIWKDSLDYQDCCTMRIFESRILGEKVQISLREKFISFKAAWNSIPPAIYWEILNKRSPKYIGSELVREHINSLVWLHESVFLFDFGDYL